MSSMSSRRNDDHAGHVDLEYILPGLVLVIGAVEGFGIGDLGRGGTDVCSACEELREPRLRVRVERDFSWIVCHPLIRLG